MILGTAQLVRPYGYGGSDSRSDSGALLAAAAASDVAALDTAPGYGEAEAVIGSSQVKLPVFTKIPRGADPVRSVRTSLGRLQRDRVDRVFFHDPEIALRAPAFVTGAAAALKHYVERGIGVSVYDAEQFEACLRHPDIAAIQAPISAVDRRLIPLLSQVDPREKAVFARSIFLQGVLLSDPSGFPEHLSALAPAVSAVRQVARDFGRSLLELLVVFVRDLKGVAGVVLGADSVEQLHTNVAAIHSPEMEFELREALLGVEMPDESVLDPRNWPSLPSGTQR